MLERYKYTETEIKNILKSITVLVDTREQKNEHITSYFDRMNIPYKKIALEHGDYSFLIPKNEDYGIMRDLYFYNEIYIERKGSATELAGNFSTHRNRFEEEFALSFQAKKYLLIENCQYEDIMNGKYKGEYSSKSYLGSLHSFNHRYNLEIVFMPNNEITPIYIYGVFSYYARSILKY